MRLFFTSLILILCNCLLIAQKATPDDMVSMDLECIDCALEVKIKVISEVDCISSDLEIELDIQGEYDQDGIEWEGNSTPTANGGSWLIPKNTGEYKVKVKKGEACVATDVFDSENPDPEIMEQFFKDNCFVSIPVGFDNTGGGGLRDNPANGRNGMGLVVEIEGLEDPVDITDLFAVPFNGFDQHFSSECEGYNDGYSAFVGGAAVAWAHVIPLMQQMETLLEKKRWMLTLIFSKTN